MREGTKISTASHMEGTVKKLLIRAMKGNIDAAGLLIKMHADNKKQGDFYVPVKLVARP
jgi:hypothetical protein